jgi:hypothetical protein
MQTVGGAGGFEPMEGRRVRFLLLIPVTILFLMTHSARSQSRGTPAKKSAAKESTAASRNTAKKLSPAANAWVESTLRKMTVDEKIGQLLFTTYHGSFTATDSAAYHNPHSVKDLHVGGFINVTHGSPLGIVKSRAYPTAVLNGQLQSKSKLPLLIGADFERGTAMRLMKALRSPPRCFRRGGDSKDAYTMGKITRWNRAPSAFTGSRPRHGCE